MPLTFASYSTNEEPVVPMRGTESRPWRVAYHSHFPKPVFDRPANDISQLGVMSDFLANSGLIPIPKEGSVSLKIGNIVPKLQSMVPPQGTGSVARTSSSSEPGEQQRGSKGKGKGKGNLTKETT
jgi:hypothetical protein